MPGEMDQLCPGSIPIVTTNTEQPISMIWCFSTKSYLLNKKGPGLEWTLTTNLLITRLVSMAHKTNEVINVIVVWYFAS